MAVDYTPTLGDYKELKPFRYWCQKVLPLVYDDSLSYYELLCKVVDYLNKTMEDVDTLHDDVDALHDAYVSLQNYVNHYFDNLDVQEEINNKLNIMASDGTLTTLITPLMPDIVTNWLNEHITPTTPIIDDTLTISGAGADAKVTGDYIRAINSVVNQKSRLANYLYKRDTYLNASNVETTLEGYDLYRIPLSYGDCLDIRQVRGSEFFYVGLAEANVYDVVKNNEIVSVSRVGTSEWGWVTPYNLNNDFKLYAAEEISAVYVCIKRGGESYLDFTINSKYTQLNNTDALKYSNAIYTLNDDNSVICTAYRDDIIRGGLSEGYFVRTAKVNSGDKVYISQRPTGVNFWGKFSNITLSSRSVNITQNYVVPSDGYIDFFYRSGEDITVTIYPKNSITIEYSNIKNIPSEISPYAGLNGVAFGTSLTYRGQAGQTGGYLQYLPALAQMTFDNQGIGSSYILGNMLTAIKNYTGYANKNVCLLEGFVNDWYYNKTLGTHNDTGETTVCGCVRSAINYMLAQNPNMTIFLLLDHYGRDYNDVNNSTTAKNGLNQTQYEYYEEIAKVAESLGVPVIKVYAESQISENTPQYLLDNIHPTALGAKQVAYTIWSEMKTKYPNQITV